MTVKIADAQLTIHPLWVTGYAREIHNYFLAVFRPSRNQIGAASTSCDYYWMSSCEQSQKDLCDQRQKRHTLTR